MLAAEMGTPKEAQHEILLRVSLHRGFEVIVPGFGYRPLTPGDMVELQSGDNKTTQIQIVDHVGVTVGMLIGGTGVLLLALAGLVIAGIYQFGA